MIDVMAVGGMPFSYNHWSYGKEILSTRQNYKTGQTGLAYEIVVNTNPSIAYLMENNSMTMQALVMAHSICGHGSVYKNNYLFRTWTDADSIIDYTRFAANFVKKCEDLYGADRVEKLLDACHALQGFGVDKYKQKKKSKDHTQNKLENRLKYLDESLNDVYTTTTKQKKIKVDDLEAIQYPQENILKFVEKHSPILESWQREIVRIVRKMAQHFYPHYHTKMLHEGWASFIHYTIMTDLEKKGLINEGSYIEFIESHTGVCCQRDYTNKFYNGLNPYKLGFSMFKDLRRICENPTKEELKEYPEIANTDWRVSLINIVRNFRDESFILQYLTKNVVQELQLFTIFNEAPQIPYNIVTSTQKQPELALIRESLARQYSIQRFRPDIEISGCNFDGNRRLQLVYKVYKDKDLTKDWKRTNDYLQELWGFGVDISAEDVS